MPLNLEVEVVATVVVKDIEWGDFIEIVKNEPIYTNVIQTSLRDFEIGSAEHAFHYAIGKLFEVGDLPIVSVQPRYSEAEGGTLKVVFRGTTTDPTKKFENYGGCVGIIVKTYFDPTYTRWRSMPIGK